MLLLNYVSRMNCFFPCRTFSIISEGSTSEGRITFQQLQSYLLSAGLPNAREQQESTKVCRLEEKYKIVQEKRAEIFGNIYNAEGKRIGNRYLERPMIGSEQFSYGLTHMNEIQEITTKTLKDSVIMKIPTESMLEKSKAGLVVTTEGKDGALLDHFIERERPVGDLGVTREDLVCGSLSFVPVTAEKVLRHIRGLRKAIRSVGKVRAKRKK